MKITSVITAVAAFSFIAINSSLAQQQHCFGEPGSYTCTTGFCPAPKENGDGPLVAFAGPGYCSQCRGVNPAIDNKAYLESTAKPAFGAVYTSGITGMYPQDDFLIARALAGVQNRGLIFKNYGENGLKAVYRREWKPEEITKLHTNAEAAKTAGTISPENYVTLINIQPGDLRPSAGVWLNTKTGENLYPFAGSGDSNFKTAEAAAFIPQVEAPEVLATADNTESPLAGLIKFLETNAVLSPGADKAEFVKTLSALKNL